MLCCSASLPVVFGGRGERHPFFFFTLLPRVTHAITWNTAKTPWKTHPTQDETENRDKAARLRELTHIWSARMNIYGGKPVTQLVFISQYPPKEEVTFTPATSPSTVVGRGAFSQPCQEVRLRSSHVRMKERRSVLWTSPTSPYPWLSLGGRWLLPGSSASHPAKLSTDQRYGRLTNRMFKSGRHQRPE